MARRRYSIKESLNRILRTYKDTPIPSDQPETLSGEVLSEDEALSDLAELFEGSLPGESLFVPDSMSSRFGQIFAEATTGTSQSLTVGEWTIVSGFTDNGLSSDGVTPDYLNNRITLSKSGTYFVHFGISFDSPNGVATNLHFEIALDGTRQDAVSAKRGISASSVAVGNANAMGFVEVTAGQDLTLYILSEDSNRIIHILETQLNAKKVA